MAGNMLNGAQVIVDYLIQEKVPQVFGLCGHGNIQFIDALYERSHDIKTISVHHESVAGFMADVYYRVSGRPTATFTSCGPGSANLPISPLPPSSASKPFSMAASSTSKTAWLTWLSARCISSPWRLGSRRPMSRSAFAEKT